ncbi:hypothetical protein LFL96_36865 (plasmid) [Paraburkholderia sp. D15]|uniref:hypothetical protein n=1 Tax=Paraburkholderia sp. D15 TaxID=2880218 RepID=UPI0024796DED|nr:hypothetical protein [Paraburkholderia sp. D15]WGS55051.1 hypothetical protein LFL96_36865 [Paraburkholderia sp. D15]
MKSKLDLHARTSALTLAVRPAAPRIGTIHTYDLNGTTMRDVLIDGKWITTVVAVANTQQHAA